MRERKRPACERVAGTSYELHGAFGECLRRVQEAWLLTVPAANPGMLEMLHDRDRLPRRHLVPWAGEFPGKYLTSATQVLRLTGDERLRATLADFVAELLRGQDESGYLGPWPRDHALTNSAPNTGDPKQTGPQPTWDTWGHYHVMLGLLLWSEEGDPKALRAARRIADLLCDRYLPRSRSSPGSPARHSRTTAGDAVRRESGRDGGKPLLVETGSTEMNLSPVHALALLYRRTGSERYLELAREIVAELSATGPDGAPLAGNYLDGALHGKRFYELPKPRWESLHPIMGLAELHRITGEDDYRRAFERLWWSIREGDRHNNGGFSSGEQATGNPYHPGAVESCCTVAWIAMSVEMLKLTADPRVADELELSTLNSGVGMHSPSGRWATYNTPMDGVRKASLQEIAWQGREGTPELNCCSVNTPRALGMLSDWGAVADREGAIILNWYGPSTIVLPRPGRPERAVTLVQDTRYPYDGRIALSVRPAASARFALRLRIPAWSERTSVRLNGEKVAATRPGSYLTLERKWRRGDTVELRLDMSAHLWPGERECEGLTSIYRGPILLSYDRRYNDMDPPELPAIDLRAGMRGRSWRGPRAPALLLEAGGAGGRAVRLVDFASAGNGGIPYRSWLPVLRPGDARRSPFVPGGASEP